MYWVINWVEKVSLPIFGNNNISQKISPPCTSKTLYVMFTDSRQESSEPKLRDEIPFRLGDKKVFFNWFEWTLPPHATHWLASCFIGLTKISLTKTSFNYPSIKELPLRLPPLKCNQALSHRTQNKIQTVTVYLTQCDCLYPCPFHITFFIPWVDCFLITSLGATVHKAGPKIPRRILRSSRPQETFQPPQQGFFSVHVQLQLLGKIFRLFLTHLTSDRLG